jgi:hypothetical protein
MLRFENKKKKGNEMNKATRIIIAALLLLGILFLARNSVVWAGVSSAATNNAADQSQVAAQNANPNPGTVKPPPVVVPPITKTGTYAVGGVCTIIVEQLADTTSLHAQLLPFDVLKARPDGTSRYLAGVCDLTYHISGKLVSNITSTDGTVQVCFAALPNITSKIYVYDVKSSTWTALDTTLSSDNLLECAVASQTGRYVLAATQP